MTRSLQCQACLSAIWRVPPVILRGIKCSLGATLGATASTARMIIQLFRIDK